MANQRELLHKFARELEIAPQGSKDRASLHEGEFNFSTNIRTGSVDPNVGMIQVFGSMRPYDLTPLMYVASDLGLRVVVKPQDKRLARVLFDPLNGFTSKLKGSEVEVDTSNTSPDISCSAAFWDDWKKWGIGEVYREGIYPNTLATVRKFLPALSDERIIAVDLFGGDGEFAKILAPVVRRRRVENPEIHVIDVNLIALSKAKKWFASQKRAEVVVHDPIDLAGAVSVFPEIDTPPNLVTAIGGLCQHVVTRAEALNITKKIYDGMQEGGLFVATGYTEMRLNSTDFQEIGFTVEQMTVPPNVLSLASPYQMYVLRK